MAMTSESLAFDRGGPIVLQERADAVMGFRADAELQARIEELAQHQPKANSRKMSAPKGYVRANKFVVILKRQAQQIANSRS